MTQIVGSNKHTQTSANIVKMRGSYLMLMLMIVFGLAKQGFSQRCGLFDERTEQCISLPTSTLCGMPPVTFEQTRQAAAAAETIEAIRQIGGPIVEGSPEAAQLGISVENPIIDLTFTQENFYRRCQNANLLTPDSGNVTEEGQEFIPFRRKRQAQSNSCCSPSPNTVRVVASVDRNGRPVQLVQPQGLAQLFQDTTNCPSATCTGQIACGPVTTLVPAEVMVLQPPGLTRINIEINICGAVTTVTVG
ncbi:hypothetical protein HOLleu_10135 [Holothuria leucospilota]|uniref:Uncharacterized protein n=1 Tax=Holothuria leucospilota TaxID=206669 RepID=A0A9Q1CEC1_HOLLE|nr:hypothetical protein HOLleu_10135 [Holothuria leucospilota]